MDLAAWNEPLNLREIEILKLISTGLSNREIAQKLHLSPETVKWYNKQIFGKLGVNSRTAAVAKAGDYHLLMEESPAPVQTAERAGHNLPAQWTSFVGRQAEIAEIKALLRAERLVTLSGPGGSGKTRLALQVARDLVGAYRQGVWFVELAALSEPSLVANSIAQTLRIATLGDEPIVEILKRSLARKHLLLILDNFEHLLEGAPLVTELLSAAPQLSILATSRERLHVYGEQEYAVDPLRVPDLHHRVTISQWLDMMPWMFVQRRVSSRFYCRRSSGQRHRPNLPAIGWPASGTGIGCVSGKVRIPGLASRTLARQPCNLTGRTAGSTCPAAHPAQDDRVELQPAQRG
jgi:DNA-binding CsgD family transcriptional regulator